MVNGVKPAERSNKTKITPRFFFQDRKEYHFVFRVMQTQCCVLFYIRTAFFSEDDLQSHS